MKSLPHAARPALAAALFVATLASAAAADLRVATPQLPTTPDPVVSTLGTNWLVASNVCEGLFGLDKSWQPQPMLAEASVLDEKALTLTVKLRSGVKFHSGSPLTADDVVASLERYAGSAGTGAVFKSLVKEIKATDAHTVVLSLTGPTGVVQGLLTLTPASIMSKASIAGKTGSTPVAQLDCTGPYKQTEFQPDRQAVLTRYADYAARKEPASAGAGAKVAVADRLIFLPQAEPSVRRDSVITGAADIATNLPFDFYKSLKNNLAVQPLVIDDTQSLTLVFNTKKGLAANAKLRLAIYHALDMDPLMMAAEGDRSFYALDPSWVPDRGSFWHTTAGGEGYGKANLSQVKQLLQEAGYKGELLRWLTSKDFYQQHYLPALVAQQQLEKAGIKIDLQVVPSANFTQLRTDPDKFELFSSFLPTYVDPVVIPYLNSSFPGFWDDPRKNELVKKLATTIDPKTRLVVWNEIQKLIYAEMPFLKYGTEAQLMVARRGMQGLPSSAADLSAQRFYNVTPPAAR